MLNGVVLLYLPYLLVWCLTYGVSLSAMPAGVMPNYSTVYTNCHVVRPFLNVQKPSVFLTDTIFQFSSLRIKRNVKTYFFIYLNPFLQYVLLDSEIDGTFMI